MDNSNHQLSCLNEDGLPVILESDCVDPAGGIEEEFLCLICECVAYEPTPCGECDVWCCKQCSFNWR